MKGWLGLVLVAIGIVLAASFGARNGPRHIEYRQALAGIEHAEDDAAKAAAQAKVAEVGLPGPTERISQWFGVGGLGWGIGILVIGAGAFLARKQAAEDAAGGGDTVTSRVDFVASVGRVRATIDEIRRAIAVLPMDTDDNDSRQKLDDLDAEVVQPLVEGRGQLVAKHGLAGFATYFGPFSAGERNLNRCWSALTDGHAVVAREALEIADQAFVAALDAYTQVDAS